MPNNTPMGRQGQGLNMNIPESAQAIENPQNNEEVYLGSFSSVLRENMGAYVVIDSNNCLHEEATLWFKDRQPKYGVKFWDVVDEWIVLGIQF